MATPEERFTFEAGRGPVTATWAHPAKAKATLVIAHGAGGNLDGPFLVGCSRALNEAGIATMRFNFDYTEAGRKSPDAEGTLRKAWLAAFAEASRRSKRSKLPVFAGGKSMGGRYASMCVADDAMPASGLVFLGYPMHPPGRPEKLRDAHLYGIEVPMLFIEGTRDPFVHPISQLREIVAKLKAPVQMHEIEGGDHSFRIKGADNDDRLIGATIASVVASFIREQL